MGKNIFSSKRNKDTTIIVDDDQERHGKRNLLDKLNKSLFSNTRKSDDSTSSKERYSRRQSSLLGKIDQAIFSKSKNRTVEDHPDEVRAIKSHKKISLLATSQGVKRGNHPYSMFGKPIKGNLLGIDITDVDIKIAVAKLKRQEIDIIKTAYASLPQGAVEDGLIVDYDLVKDLINQMMVTHSINAQYAFFSIDNKNIIVRPATIPEMVKGEDISGFLSFELQQYLDIDLDAYVIEYQTMGNFDSEAGKGNNTLVYAVPKNMVEQDLQLANDLKLQPYVFDLQSNTLEKWLERVEAINNRSRDLTAQNIGFVQLNKCSIDVYLYSKGKFVTSNHHDGGYAELEGYLNSSAMLQSLPAIASGELDDHLIKTALDNWLSRAHSHIVNTEHFFTSNTNEVIDTFYVFGNQDICWHLTSILRSKLNRDIESIDSVDCERISWDAEAEFSAEFIPAVAMLIRRSS